MDQRTLKIVGWIVAAIGAVMAVIGGFADQLGLGGEGPDEFGGRQVAMLVAGLVVLAVGLVVALVVANRATATSQRPPPQAPSPQTPPEQAPPPA